jgi:hypothetical protein
MEAFYVGRAIKLAADVKAGAAPPPAGSVWVAQDDDNEEKEK